MPLTGVRAKRIPLRSCRSGALDGLWQRRDLPRRARVPTANPVFGSGRGRNLEVELVKNAGRGVQNLLIDRAVLSNGFGERNGNNLVSAQRRHLSEFTAVHHVDGAQAVTRSQHAVVGGGRSAALNMSEDYRARLEAGTLFDLIRQRCTNSAQANVSEFVATPLRA